MSTAQDVLDAITAQKTVVGGLKVFVDDLKKQLSDALAAGSLVTQAQLDGIFADVTSNNADIAAAMVANTPPPPPGP